MAAPEAVLVAAGGAITPADGLPPPYNTAELERAGCLIPSYGVAHVDR